MSWLVRENEENPIQVLREQLDKEGIITIPGAHDAMAAILAKKAGFKTIYLSGGALTASLGLPDLGVATLSEFTQRTKEIVRATGMPVLVDVDTGFGGILNVTRTVYEMMEVGAAAIQIEDQELPKKCGHLNGKKVISKEEMVKKIQAARKASKDIVIVARTDAKAIEGIDSALDRAKAYYEAGADVIFPEALNNEDEFKYFAKNTNFPLLANMTEFGRTPLFSAEDFAEMGYKMVIFPVSSLRISAKAVSDFYEDLYETGTQKNTIDKMQTRKELYNVLLYDDYEALDETIAKTDISDLYQ